ncbi:hypothetical protein D9758_005712 [Tetrapyrgos nigripes]|uniref:DUF6535 domain-containing protein n=1 Tax=Tetrapyrgos nigripes TaxID=182062 RepID=A0A8H5GJX7_9AGAR|nr:hypothetical protein D9758_005712 [Tetrapyrgos nigripes]
MEPGTAKTERLQAPDSAVTGICAASILSRSKPSDEVAESSASFVQVKLDEGNVEDDLNGLSSSQPRRSADTARRSQHDSSYELPRIWKDGAYKCAPSRHGDPWEECMKRVNKFDEEMCKGWRDDIDTLLVFAGLFSSAVTAFTVESYQWLQEDPKDIQVALLLQISRQLSDPTLNTTTASQIDAGFVPSTSAIRINIFWFLSLILSLTTVLIGILCKQWLREYQRDVVLSQQQSLELRQMRFESLERWGVPGILAALPLLLQVSLVFFFAGVLDLLWSYNVIVAIFATVVVGLGLSIIGITTILPTYYILSLNKQPSQDIFPCPFKSPQSWLFHRLVLSIIQITFSGAFGRRPGHYFDWVSCDIHLLRTYRYLNLYDPDAYLARGMDWVIKTYGDSVIMAKHIFHCLQTCSVRVGAYAMREDMETATRDAVNLKFVEAHWRENVDTGRDPGMKRFAIELTLRTVNARSSPVIGASGALKKLAGLIHGYDGPGLGDDLWLQIVASIRQYVAEERASVDDILPLLEIFECCWHARLSTHVPPISTSSQDILRHLAVEFLNDFEGWLNQTDHDDLRWARVSEAAAALIRVIYYMVHYFSFSSYSSSNLLCSERFARLVRMIDEEMIEMDIEAECLPGVGRYGSLRFTWQEAKDTVLRRSELPPDYFRVTEAECGSTDS